MNALFSILAAGTTQPSSPPPGWFDVIFKNPLFIMVLVLAVFYLFMMKSKRGEERKRQDMLAQLKKGDRIQTIGGILGTVMEARDSEVLVKVDEGSNTKIRFARSAIHRVLPEEKSQTK